MRHFMSGNLHTQVTSGYHDAVSRLNDLVNIFYTFCVLYFGNDINTVPAMFMKQFFDFFNCITMAHKGCSNKVNSLFNTEKNIFFILFRNCRKLHVNIRDIDSFSLSQFSAVDDPADDIFIFNFFYCKLNQTIINQDRIARFHIFLQSFIRLMTDGTISNKVSAGERKDIALFQHDLLTVLQKSCTDLRSLGIQKNRNRQFHFLTYSFQ